MTEPLETYRGAVYPWHMDHVGHMNVQHYVAKFDEATWHLFAHLGMTPGYFREANRGMAAVQQNITYASELRAGDLVMIYSSVLEIGGRKVRFRHSMVNCETGEEAASAEMLGVHVDRAARKSCAIPADVVAAGQRLVESSS